MATSCPIGFDPNRLRDHLTRTCERVAADPASGFHFDVGPRDAVEVRGYPREEVESLPAACPPPTRRAYRGSRPSSSTTMSIANSSRKAQRSSMSTRVEPGSPPTGSSGCTE